MLIINIVNKVEFIALVDVNNLLILQKVKKTCIDINNKLLQTYTYNRPII